MSKRWEVTRAVRASALPAPARLIMLVLADVAEVGTAEIPQRFTPSLKVLACETGLDKSTVCRHLPALEEAGWIVRSQPSSHARARGERTRYRLAVPEAAPEKASQTLGDPEVETPVAPESPQSHSATTVVAENDNGGRTVRQGVVAENDNGGRTVRPPINRKSDLLIKSDLSSSVAAPRQRTPKGDEQESPIKANSIVQAYLDGSLAAGQERPTSALIGRVGRDAKRLLAEGVDPDRLLAAADAMGRAGWQSLDVQLQRDSVQRARADGRAPEPKRDGRTVSSAESLQKWVSMNGSRSA